MTTETMRRRLSAGVELLKGGRASVRVWAPACHRVDIVFDTPGRTLRTTPLDAEDDGYFSGVVIGVTAGDLYRFRLDGDRLRPDPASRYQPDGPHGPSAIVDPDAFVWTDSAWPGIGPVGHVIYEMHIGTFTPQGTWAAAARELPEIARLGVSVIEMMPIADFAGRFGWGYDGVNLYAPTRLYGTPDDLRGFVDRAHAVGVAVILDVVYNHLGPDGNYLAEFSPDYLTDRYKNDWGQAINFEGPAGARAHFVENAGYWIDEFHFDGLRLDATQDIRDGSEEHVIASLVSRARAAAGPRPIYIVAENEPQDTRLVRARTDGGYEVDALWNDDYHHAAAVALTGRREAYYTDYTGSPQEFVSSAKYGYLYQGQWFAWQKEGRGTPALDLPARAFITFLENHDQVANSAYGRRLHQISSPGRHRALTALTLLGPATPMLFQGQEFSSSKPFLFFADHHEGLRSEIRAGRGEFLSQFPSCTDPEIQAALPPPDDEETFTRCKLDFRERERQAAAYRLHQDLIALRRADPVFHQDAERRVDGAVIAASAFCLRFDAADFETRVLIVNLGRDLDVTPLPEPLLAPPPGFQWGLQWSSEAATYGGNGQAPLKLDGPWHIPGEAAIVLRAERVVE
ncbi:MAG TPA: malto-oligosyltrehalose trehalohydrolase [Vicinamibacterales bacterium]|jgi:maltooligosyltrehalose trehalohydrolase|nr:malto-oligosyltrehalose trehalohydrolase [Vicinamibacterales bacterium]